MQMQGRLAASAYLTMVERGSSFGLGVGAPMRARELCLMLARGAPSG